MRINLNRTPDDELMDAAITPPKIVIGRRKPKPVKRQHPESSSHASSKTSGKNALLIQSA